MLQFTLLGLSPGVISFVYFRWVTNCHDDDFERGSRSRLRSSSSSRYKRRERERSRSSSRSSSPPVQEDDTTGDGPGGSEEAVIQFWSVRQVDLEPDVCNVCCIKYNASTYLNNVSVSDLHLKLIQLLFRTCLYLVALDQSVNESIFLTRCMVGWLCQIGLCYMTALGFCWAYRLTMSMNLSCQFRTRNISDRSWTINLNKFLLVI